MDVNIAIGSMAHYYSTNEQEKSCFQWFRTSLTFVRFQKKKKSQFLPQIWSIFHSIWRITYMNEATEELLICALSDTILFKDAF